MAEGNSGRVRPVNTEFEKKGRSFSLSCFDATTGSCRDCVLSMMNGSKILLVKLFMANGVPPRDISFDALPVDTSIQ